VGEGEEEGEERRGGVRVTFEDGTTDEGELLVGCDGLNSTVRELVFDAKPAQYKGIIIVRSPSLPLPVQVPPNTARHSTQIGGLSPRPPTPLPPTLLQIFGDGAHFLSAPLSPTLMGWQCALPEPRPSSDSWRPVPLSTTAGRAMLSALPQARWTGAGRVVTEAVGAYRHAVCLRPPLEEWHSGRVVLVGDAANAATPHLGQGANQVRSVSFSSHFPSYFREVVSCLAVVYGLERRVLTECCRQQKTRTTSSACCAPPNSSPPSPLPSRGPVPPPCSLSPPPSSLPP